MGAYVVYFRAAKISNPIPILWFKQSWRKISPWILIGLFVLFSFLAIYTGESDGVAHWAHLGGFFFGLVFALTTYQSTLKRNMFLKFINNEKKQQ